MSRTIDKNLVRERMLEMIELLEFDSMRSAGKAKLNSQHLHSMYWLLENVYEPEVKKPTTLRKEG